MGETSDSKGWKHILLYCKQKCWKWSYDLFPWAWIRVILLKLRNMHDSVAKAPCVFALAKLLPPFIVQKCCVADLQTASSALVLFPEKNSKHCILNFLLKGTFTNNFEIYQVYSSYLDKLEVNSTTYVITTLQFYYFQNFYFFSLLSHCWLPTPLSAALFHLLMRLTVFCNYLLHNPGCSGTKGMLTQKRKKNLKMVLCA